MDRGVFTVLIDEGVGWIPYPSKSVPFCCSRVKELDIVEDGLSGVLQENLTVTILGGKEGRKGEGRKEESRLICRKQLVLTVIENTAMTASHTVDML